MKFHLSRHESVHSHKQTLDLKYNHESAVRCLELLSEVCVVCRRLTPS